MRKMIAVIALTGAALFASSGIASALPANAPNVVGLSESDAVATLQAAGIKVRVATRNGSCALSDQVVHHQQDLSGTTKGQSKIEYKTITRTVKVVDLVTGEVTYEQKSRSVPRVVRTEVPVAPSTTLNMTCK